MILFGWLPVFVRHIVVAWVRGSIHCQFGGVKWCHLEDLVSGHHRKHIILSGTSIAKVSTIISCQNFAKRQDADIIEDFPVILLVKIRETFIAQIRLICCNQPQ
jgi:hypothetical protein